MARVYFRFKKNLNSWESIEKAISHKYIAKFAKPNGKGFYYIYKENFLHPIKTLAEVFGINQKRIDSDFEKHNIEKDFNVNKKVFASHVLEFFVNRKKWNEIFSKKENRERYKKPIKQEVVEKQASKKLEAKKAKTSSVKSTEKKTTVINRSLMRKVWALYSPEAKKDRGNGGGNNGSIAKKIDLLKNIFKTEKSEIIKNKNIGDVFIDVGTTGKSGYGLKHIIEQRATKDKASNEEIIATLALVLDTVENGDIIRDVKYTDKNNIDIGTITLEKNGIIAFLGKSKNGTGDKFVITGYADNRDKKSEATDAIREVISQNNYAPNFVIVKDMVGAVIASIGTLSDENGEKSIENEAEAPQVTQIAQANIDKTSEKIDAEIEKWCDLIDENNARMAKIDKQLESPIDYRKRRKYFKWWQRRRKQWQYC